MKGQKRRADISIVRAALEWPLRRLELDESRDIAK